VGSGHLSTGWVATCCRTGTRAPDGGRSLTRISRHINELDDWMIHGMIVAYDNRQPKYAEVVK